jgi:tripartite-type tricarboxylate transporter receptor subunit TctC
VRNLFHAPVHASSYKCLRGAGGSQAAEVTRAGRWLGSKKQALSKGGTHMKPSCRRGPRTLAVALGLSLGATIMTVDAPARSQPGKSITIIDPFPAGGTADILARLLAQHIGKAHEQTVVVENHPGASASIGYDLVSRAAPDGTTLVIAADSIVVNPLLRKSNYDPLKDFAPICYLANSPLVFVVESSSPYRSIGDLVAAAHANPGRLTFAGLGPASARRIQFEQFKRATNVDMIFVPYPGGAPVVNALLGQQVTVGLVNYSEAVSQLAAGKLRALATGAPTRIKPLPDVPTVAESGYSRYKADVWFGVLAPAKTPDDMIKKFAAWFTEALDAPEVQERLPSLGLAAVGLCGPDYTRFIDGQYQEYGRVIRDANLKLE